MTLHAGRDIAILLAGGLLLAACGATAAVSTSPLQRHLEASACQLISATAILPPDSGSFGVISVPTSTLLALRRTNDRSLRAVVRTYEEAAIAKDNDAMIRAINRGVRVCHGLGLRTGM